MGFFFEPYQTDCCCLCGSPESLTGEHKVKASALRKIFGRDGIDFGESCDCIFFVITAGDEAHLKGSRPARRRCGTENSRLSYEYRTSPTVIEQ